MTLHLHKTVSAKPFSQSTSPLPRQKITKFSIISIFRHCVQLAHKFYRRGQKFAYTFERRTDMDKKNVHASYWCKAPRSCIGWGESCCEGMYVLRKRLSIIAYTACMPCRALNVVMYHSIAMYAP